MRHFDEHLTDDHATQRFAKIDANTASRYEPQTLDDAPAPTPRIGTGTTSFAVADAAVLYRAMQYASEFGMFFASHCEIHELAGPRALNEGAMSYRLGIKGSPACAEEIMIDRDIRLAHATGAHIHIQHVSSKLGMETIRCGLLSRANSSFSRISRTSASSPLAM